MIEILHHHDHDQSKGAKPFLLGKRIGLAS